MKLKHLNCTTEHRRKDICCNYIVHADDCIVLYGGRVVRSDANNREIRDRYYQFSCVDKDTQEKYIIVCGSGTARHFCSLINEKMPKAMNPFVRNGEGGRNNRENGDEDGNQELWNPMRRLLYYAIQLFITRYQENLIPGTKIFQVLHSVEDESFIHIRPKAFLYRQFAEVVRGFNTNMTAIIEDLLQYGPLRNFDFTDLQNEFHRMFPDEENIFL